MSKENVMKKAMKKMLKPLFYLLAMIYFLVDAVFMAVAVHAGRWLADPLVSNRIRNWIVSLRPYPTLMLFAVPIIILEPVKPLAIYLIGTKHVVAGVTLFVLCEILKLVLVERLFALSREKLLSIPAFAWGYDKYSAAKHWVVSLEACRKVQKWARRARCAIQRQIAVTRRLTSIRRATPNPA
jgi:hypothetical protein